ncbi:MAG: hypothetical protein JWP27_932, partial [Flaviaesturariibacter sp.]|nr:hypothetical protein [Flaviaesturariibacter sp.]
MARSQAICRTITSWRKTKQSPARSRHGEERSNLLHLQPVIPSPAREPVHLYVMLTHVSTFPSKRNPRAPPVNPCTLGVSCLRMSAPFPQKATRAPSEREPTSTSPAVTPQLPVNAKRAKKQRKPQRELMMGQEDLHGTNTSRTRFKAFPLAAQQARLGAVNPCLLVSMTCLPISDSCAAVSDSCALVSDPCGPVSLSCAAVS